MQCINSTITAMQIQELSVLVAHLLLVLGLRMSELVLLLCLHLISCWLDVQPRAPSSEVAQITSVMLCFALAHACFDLSVPVILQCVSPEVSCELFSLCLVCVNRTSYRRASCLQRWIGRKIDWRG